MTLSRYWWEGIDELVATPPPVSHGGGGKGHGSRGGWSGRGGGGWFGGHGGGLPTITASAAVLYGKISKTADENNTGNFEPTFPNVDYAGPAGMTTTTANRLTVQSPDDYLGIYYANYQGQYSSESHALFYDGATLLGSGQSARHAYAASSLGRQQSGFVAGSLAAGNDLRANQYLTNLGTTHLVRASSALSLLRPGTLVCALTLGSDTAVSTGDPVPLDTVKAGYSAFADLPNNRITVQNTGWHLIAGGVKFSTTLTQPGLTISGAVSGNVVEGIEDDESGNDGTYAAGLAYLTAGETISATVHGTGTLFADATSLSLWLLQDADVLGIWGISANYTIPNATTGFQPITYDNALRGSGALMATSGKFTIQSTGWYLVWLAMANDRLSTGFSYLGPGAYNETTGEKIAFGNDIQPAVGVSLGRSTIGAIYATAGDLISCQAYTLSGQPQYRVIADYRSQFGLVQMTGAA